MNYTMRTWLELALDYRCNLRCLGCHACHDTGERLAGEQAGAILRAHRAEGITSLWIGGGEPTLRDDLFPLVATARKLGFERVLVQTNGMRLAYPAYAEALLRAGVTDLSLNIKSHLAHQHDALSGGESHALVVRALENLSGRDVRLAADVLLTRTTSPELEATVGFFAARGVRRFVLWLLSAADVATTDVRAEVPRFKDLVPHLLRAREAARRLDVELVSLHTPPCTLPGAIRDVVVSAASLGLTVVGPDGREFPLEVSSFEGGAFLPGCDACSARVGCSGPRADYLAIHGEADLVPLRAMLGER
jgi:MoaA/NifB/PqqE/SkfB family radical SAM enzyme